MFNQHVQKKPRIVVIKLAWKCLVFDMNKIIPISLGNEACVEISFEMRYRRCGCDNCCTISTYGYYSD